MAETDLNQSLRESAAGPAKVSIDGQTTEEHDLGQQVEAVKFQQSTKARRQAPFGVAFAKLRPHGASE